jgi:hypothetical protein
VVVLEVLVVLVEGVMEEAGWHLHLSVLGAPMPLSILEVAVGDLVQPGHLVPAATGAPALLSFDGHDAPRAIIVGILQLH